MELELKIEDGGLWIEDRHSRFGDLIMPHLHLTHVFLFILDQCKVESAKVKVQKELLKLLEPPELLHLKKEF